MNIAVQDRRDETIPKIVIVLTDLPATLTKDFPRFLGEEMRLRFAQFISLRESRVTIEKLQAALAAGIINQTQFDQLTMGG